MGDGDAAFGVVEVWAFFSVVGGERGGSGEGVVGRGFGEFGEDAGYVDASGHGRGGCNRGEVVEEEDDEVTEGVATGMFVIL